MHDAPEHSSGLSTGELTDPLTGPEASGPRGPVRAPRLARHTVTLDDAFDGDCLGAGNPAGCVVAGSPMTDPTVPDDDGDGTPTGDEDLTDGDGDTATARMIWTGTLNVTAFEKPALYDQGREYDKLVKQDGKWLFKKRVIIADGFLPRSMLDTWERKWDYDITAE